MNVLIFPCGSEVALEVTRALTGKRGIKLFQMGEGGEIICPYVSEPDFIDEVKRIIKEFSIDVIYPCNDQVLLKLKEHEGELCKVIGPSLETVRICNSKRLTYETLKDVCRVPVEYSGGIKYPAYIKPDVGHSGIDCHKVNNIFELRCMFKAVKDHLVLEYLPGPEYTVDCFSDQFAEGRERIKITKGIASHTRIIKDERFSEIAKAIQSKLNFPGAWFFQVKEKDGELVLMEVGARIAGSSGIQRLRGVNLPLLNLYESKVKIKPQNYVSEIVRTLSIDTKLNYPFDKVYVDLDDTLIIEGKVNYILMAFLFKCRNEGKKVCLITRHKENLHRTLMNLFISDGFFERIIHITDEPKSDFIEPGSILIDDSFKERSSVSIPAFDTDAIQSLL